MCGCLLCRKGGERAGPHSAFVKSNSDWLLQSKSPISEPPITSSLIPLPVEGAGRTKPGDPHIQNTVSCMRVSVCVCVFSEFVRRDICMFASVGVCVGTSGISGFV